MADSPVSDSVDLTWTVQVMNGDNKGAEGDGSMDVVKAKIKHI